VNWRWIDRQALVLLHDESLAEHGGSPGIRDEGLLESALARARNLAAYGAPDIADLAASYAVGLAKNHPFVDGNKRAAFLGIGLFLMLNGRRLVATQLDTTMTMLGVAAGDVDEAALAARIREHSRKRSLRN
jgi:death on curing protein